MAESDRPSGKKSSSKKPPASPPPGDGGPFGDGWDLNAVVDDAPPAGEEQKGDPYPELDNIFTELPNEGFPGESTGVGAIPVDLDDEMTPEPELFTAPAPDHTDELRDMDVSPPPSLGEPTQEIDAEALGPAVTAPSRARRPTPPPVPMMSDVAHPAAPAPSATQPATIRARAKPPRPAPPPEPEPQEEPQQEEASAPPEDEEPTIFNDNAMFRAESTRLARVRDWQKLAAITSAAAAETGGARWANLPETRAALLGDLARIYRDRLKDLPSAEDTFRRMAALDPANPDAIDFLSERFRERGDWKALYDLYGAAIEPTWDPNLRLEWTRQTVQIATEKLGSPDLAIESWEKLWRLGDAVEETSRALSEVYRRAGRWDRLAEFLAKRASSLTGAERIVALREIAEAYLSGLRDQDKAAGVLEQLLAERADDPIALLALARVLARRKDWEALAELGARSLEGLPPTAVLDFRRLVADALWGSGDLERAIVAHDRVLELDPEDADSLKAKEEYLARTGKAEVLVNFLASRAERAKTDEERGDLLSRAAQLAEKELSDPRQAVTLWERRAQIESGRLQAHEALVNLYESLNDLPGVARALEGQLALTRSPSGRIELLRRLGDHSAHRMGDDVKAEACWQEIVSIVPDDRATRDELIGLHRRRGDFEALDRALSGQAWRAIDEAEVLSCWRAAAKNVDDNIADSRRAVRSWLRVIDHAPADADALHALARHQRGLAAQGEPSRAYIGALEDELRVTADREARIERTVEIAKLWEAANDRVAALAAYERVLRWSPADATALAQVAKLRAGAEAGAAAAAFEVAAGDDSRPATERIALLRQALALLDGKDALGRFFGLRRVLWLSGRDPEVLAEVAKEAANAGAWNDLAAVYLSVAVEADSPSVRAAAHRELAAIYEERIKDPVRAFLVLQAVNLQPSDDPKQLDALVRLSAATGRHEDLLALLDVAARAGAELAGRQEAIRRRASICEGQLKDPERAFHECARLLLLDPTDAGALKDARRLAADKGLWRPLDALYAELTDRAATVEQRVEMARARHAIRTEHLSDPTGALDQLLVIYRLSPDAAGLVDQLFAAADAQKAWERVLPVVEAKIRSVGESASPEDLARIAALHEEKRNDRERAFELYAEAFVIKPAWTELKEKLERLAEATGRYELLTVCYRIAAARSGDPMHTLDLYRRIAALYDEKINRPEDALEVHRRILHLQPSALPSLEAVIAHHRVNGKVRDLRDRLQQWIERAPADAPGRVDRWLEIARVSREKLSDPETALATYAQILEVEPGNEEAIQGVRSLTEGPIDPTLELRRMKIELRRASPERRVEILLTSAKLCEEQLDDLDGARTTLRSLVDDTGAAGPGFEPLARILTMQKSWSDLVDLIESRAAVLGDGAGRIAALEQAFAVCDEHPQAAPLERKERLYRRMLEERPGDEETQRHLLSLYRDAARYEDLAGLLRSTLAALPKNEKEDRAIYESELARVLDRGLGKADEAEAVLAARHTRDPNDGEVLLDLASLKLRRGDFAGYLALREQQAKQLPPALGALVLCHLAEACDETNGQQAKVPNYYREARTLDPSNPPAMEALKAIGRRAKSWRATAAMLPDPDEAKLPWPERASRLRARGDAAANSDLAAGQSWYQRAVAVDPNHYQAWDALALLFTAQNDAQGALEAELSSLAAFERATGPEPARLREHAERIQQLAGALKATGDKDGAARLSQRAYQLQPSFATAALAVADVKLAAGETEAAFAIYDRVLRDHEADGGQKLADHERLHATFQRGALAAQLGRTDQAIADLREGLRIEALHSGVLNALADALAAKGRVAAAIQHYTQALLVEFDHKKRGALYARLGRLWEDRLSRPDEAGVCYDHAVAAGIDEGDLMLRALRHYRRSGRPERALSVIERLLPSTTEPRELAALWTERGGILAATDEDHAIEAYDMALSYDPGNQTSLAGLSQILEKRGDWEQLLQIFEARTESGGPEERAEALRALARIASTHLKDGVRTEKYLRQAIELAPTKADYEQLLAVYGDNPRHANARRGVIAGLLTIAGPFMPRVIELGKMLATQGERRWAWTVLSPLMNSTMPEQALKTLVLELRKEFEKSDNSHVLSPTTHQLVRHPDVDPAVLEVLGELDLAIQIGRTSAEECGGQGVGKLDERTAVGKTFANIATKLGLEGATLLRAQELPEPFAVLDTETPQVVVKAELLQLLSVAETGFLFSSMLEVARNGSRVLSSLAPLDRARLLPALFHAVGLGSAGDASTLALGEKIRGSVPPEQLASWAEKLKEVASRERADGGARLAYGLVETARRVGLVAAADLRFVARLLTRLDESLPKLPTVGKLDDLDEFIGGAAPVRTLLGFAATDTFGKALEG